MITSRASAAELERPVRLKAGGKLLQAAGGCAAPHVCDWNGDGVRDLLVGQLAGCKLRIYLNGGTNKFPRYGAGTWFRAAGALAALPPAEYDGFRPQFVDLDGDGHRDVISGSSRPGHTFWYRGRKSGAFGQRVALLDRTGRILDGTGTSVAGFEFASVHPAPWLVDFDEDGDLDLLIGDGEGRIILVANEGTASKHEFGTKRERVEAAGKVIELASGDAAPHTADWDGDGRWDLLSGAGDGSVWLFRNLGKRGAPSFAAGRRIVPINKQWGLLKSGETARGPGRRSKPCVVDHDGDGRLDLLVGDRFDVEGPRPKLTSNQVQRRQDLELTRQVLLGRISAVTLELEESPEKRKRALRPLEAKLRETNDAIRPLEPKREVTGWVWFFKRRAPAK